MRKKLLAIFSAIVIACSLGMVGMSVSALDDSKTAFTVASVHNNIDKGTLTDYGKMIIVDVYPISTDGYWTEIPGATDYVEIVNKDGDPVSVFSVQTCGTSIAINHVGFQGAADTTPYEIALGDTITLKAGFSFGNYELKKDVAFKYEINNNWTVVPTSYEEIEVTNVYLYNDATGGWSTPALEVELGLPAGLTIATYTDFISTVDMEYVKVADGSNGILGTFQYTNTQPTGARFLVRLANADTSNAYQAVNGDKITIKAGSFVAVDGVGYKVANDVTYVIVDDTATTTSGATTSCAKENTITFDANGGVFTGETTQTVLTGSKVAEPTTDPTKAATAEYTYTFNGWKVNGEPVDFDSYIVTGDATIVADWTSTKNSYTVTFEANGGVLTDEGTKTLEYGSLITVTEPTKEGTAAIVYTFNGWKVNGEPVDLATYTVTGDVTLVADWSESAKTYTVTFDTDNGSTIDSQTLEYGSLITVANPTKAATAEYTYTFNGWKVDGNPVDLATYTVTGDVTLVADWTATKNTYTVTFDVNGGVLGGDGTQTVEYGAVATAPTAPTKEGFTFAGWTLDGEAFNFETAITGDITLVATWTEIPAPAPEEKGGCSGALVGTIVPSMIALLAAGVVVSVKKKRD